VASLASTHELVRAAVLDDYQDVARDYADWDSLNGVEVTVFTDHLSDEAAVAERLAPFEIVVAMRERTPFRRSLLERLPNLQLLVTTGARNASIDLAAAAEHGVTVCATGYVSPPTAELTWALILALARHVPEEDANVRAGRWQTTVGADLAGRTLGIVGLGRLGARVAEIARVFEMDVIAWSQNLTAERAAEAGAELVSKADLFRRADFVTVHVVLSDRSRGLVGAPELALMKPTARLINTSRGPVVDEAALLEALDSGRIAGAALDVYEPEPLPEEHPLRRAPRSVLTPHIGYVTDGTYEIFYRDAVEDIARWRAGDPVRVLAP
jgi:phosphoglycerate dehydrogenase-like enzyme